VTMTDNERYALCRRRTRRALQTVLDRCTPRSLVVKSILERHPDDQVLVIGAYLDQLDELGEELNAPVIQGSTKTAEREIAVRRLPPWRNLHAGGVTGRELLHRSAGSQCGGAGFGHIWLASGGGAAAGTALCGRQADGGGAIFLLGRIARQPRRRVRRATGSASSPSRLRLRDQGRRTICWVRAI